MWVENMRVISVFAVIMLHVAAGFVGGVGLDHSQYGSFDWWAGNIYDSIVRWCVPLFVMLSGYLLINKQESDSDFFKKRLSRIFIPLVFWSLFFSGWTALKLVVKGKEADIYSEILLGFISGQPYFHLWYIYMIPFLYLITPLLRTLLKESPISNIKLLILFCFAFSVFNVLLDALSYQNTSTFFGNNFLLYIGYYLLGGYVAKYDVHVSVKWCGLILLLAWAATATGSYFFTYEYFYSYLSVNTVVASLCVFFIIRHYFDGNFSFGSAAACSFGVYLVHPVFLDLFSVVLEDQVSSLIGVVLYIPVASVIIFLLSYGVVRLLSCLKFTRSLV